MPADIYSRPARREDEQFIETLLSDNDLVVADLTEKWECLYVYETDTGRIGVGGLEQYGDVALLRSVAITEPERGQGYGTTLCNDLLERTRDAGVTDVYLLTETAPEFFAGLGFERVNRESVPNPMRETAEFTDFCPSTAECMKRELDPNDGAEQGVE